MHKEYFYCSLYLSNSEVCFPYSPVQGHGKKSFFLSQLPWDVLFPLRKLTVVITLQTMWVHSLPGSSSANWAQHGETMQEILTVGSSLHPLNCQPFTLCSAGHWHCSECSPQTSTQPHHTGGDTGASETLLFSAAELNFLSKLQGWVFPRRQIHQLLVLSHLTVTTAAPSWASSSES